MTVLRNFTNGELCDAGTVAQASSSTPPDVMGSAPISSPTGRGSCVPHRGKRARGVGTDDTERTPERPLGFANNLESAPDELVTVEAANIGKPLGLTSAEEPSPRFACQDSRTVRPSQLR